MRALVTGATGFVGAAVARALRGAGHDVLALVRRGSDRRNVAGVATIEGDLTDAASLARAVAGCDAVFHVAADYRLWVPEPAPMYAANVEGTRAILAAAVAAGVPRIVYTSSVATLGVRADGAPADEDTPSTIEDMIGHYKRSKFAAEAVARAMAAAGAPVVIVNPSTPVGPGDVKPTPTGRMIRDALAGKMPAYVDTGLNIVHVDDVATGHLLAWEKGTPGRRYILGGTDMSLQAILTELARIAGRHPPRWRLPYRVVLPLAYLAEGWARVSGREPLATVDGVRLSAKRMYYSSGRAERELGYTAREPRRALEDAAGWFRATPLGPEGSRQGVSVWT